MVLTTLSSLADLIGLAGRPASFRGVGFYVASTTDEYAQRGAHHQFPGKDRGLWESLGADDPVITIPAYVLGDAQKTALIAACRKPTAGRLVHPFLPARDVVCTSCKVTHEATRLGYVALELSFLDAATVPAGASASMGVADIDKQATALEASLVDQFAADFGLSGAASFVQAAALEAWAGAVDGLSAIVAALDFDLSSSPLVKDALSPLVKDALNFLGAGAEWLRPGFDLAAFAGGQISGLPDMLLSDPKGAALGWAGLARLVMPLGGNPSDLLSLAPAIPGNLSTPSRGLIAANAAALAGLVSGIAQVESVRAAVRADYPHRDAALEARECIVTDFQGWAEGAPDAQYQQIGGLARNAAALIADRSADLQRLSQIETKATQPALVLAYQQDGSIVNASDFAARNQLEHPGFVSDGAWEVLR